jgi:hypothetical protein
MKYILVALSVLSSSAAWGEISCLCPKLACDPCSINKGVSFYSSKCGPNDAKVRSCARPTCVPVDTASAECPTPPQANSGPREPIVVAQPPVEQVEDATANDKPAGMVKVVRGTVAIVHSDGKKTVVEKSSEFKEGETIDSGKDSAALATFTGGNRLQVHEETVVTVKEFKNPEDASERHSLLHLLKGKIRNQVEQKYNGKSSYYKVTTKSIVAGVRGTDFVIEEGSGDAAVTQLETLRGVVVMSTLDEAVTREIQHSEGAKFADGQLGEVYKLNPEQLKDLERSSRVDVARKAGAKDSPICQNPHGLFNQCLWRCLGNPHGATQCQVDHVKVSCVRQRCNGNGEWSEQTHLRAAAAQACPATGVLVKDCDY